MSWIFWEFVEKRNKNRDPDYLLPFFLLFVSAVVVVVVVARGAIFDEKDWENQKKLNFSRVCGEVCPKSQC